LGGSFGDDVDATTATTRTMEVVKDRIGNLDVRYHAKQTHECDSVKDDTATTTTTTTTTRRDDHKRLKSMQHKTQRSTNDNKHDDDNDDDDEDDDVS